MQKSFKCCRNKDFANLCCTVCLCVFHPSCAERLSDAVKLGGYKIFCSAKCQSLAQEQEDKDKNIRKKIEIMEKELRERDLYIARLKRTSANLDDSVYEAERKFISEIEKQNMHIQSLKEQINTLKKDEAELKKEFEVLKKEKVNLEQNMTKMTEMNKNLIVTIDALERNNDHLVEELKEIRQKEVSKKILETENLGLKQQIEGNTDETAKKQDIIRLDSVVSDLQQQLNDMREATKQSLQLLENKILQKASETRNLEKAANKSISKSPQPRQDADSVKERPESQGRNQGLDDNRNKPIHDAKIPKSAKSVDGRIIDIVTSPEAISNNLSMPPNDDIKATNEKDKSHTEWTKVVYKRGQNLKNTSSSEIKRPDPLKGSNGNITTLKPALRMTSLFLSGLSPEVTSEAVIKYLEDNDLNQNVKCLKMKTKNEKYRSSFRLTVPYSERDKYLKAGLWPTGIIINHFLNLQCQNQQRRRMSTMQRKNPDRK